MKKYNKYLYVLASIIMILGLLCFIPIRVSKFIPIIEEQVVKDFGIKIHIERLVLRVGPSLKIKAPIMHLMYDDGRKFAQFDNVKFYVPWSAILRDNIKIRKIDARRFTLKLSSNEKAFESLLNRLEERNFSDNPNIYLRSYNLSYQNLENNDVYVLNGKNLELRKLLTTDNFNLKTNGNFSINDKDYINFDIQLEPNIDLKDLTTNFDYLKFLEQLKLLDFHADIVTDLKLYKNTLNNIQYSGFINIDNISVLDENRNIPKSFIYLTLWGDKASVLSNLYTSINKKVYIDGVIKNSNRPILDLKVKTDDIKIADLYQKLKIFMNLSVFKEIDSLDGDLNANFTLKGDLKKLKSTGYVKIVNAKIGADGLNINGINSDIDLSNNKMTINKFIGYVNNSPIIIKGFIDKEINLEVIMDKVELKYLLPKNLGVTSGIASLIANVSGPLDNIIHKEKLNIDQLRIANSSCDVTVDSINMDTNQNNIAYFKNILSTTQVSEPIKIPSMKLLVNEEGIKLQNTNIYMPNSMLTAKGEILKLPNNFNFVFNLDGFINSKDLKIFKSVSTRYPVKISTSGSQSVQNLYAQVLFEKTDVFDEPVLLNLISKSEKNTVKIEDFSLNTFAGSFSNDLKQNLKGNKKVSINGSIENLKEPILKNMRIFIPQTLNVHLGEFLAQIKGDLFINGDIKKPEIVGQLSVSNLINQSIQLSMLNTILDFNKNNLVLNAPQIKIGDSSLNANALISTDISDAILIKNVNVKSKFLNTDTILMYKDVLLLNDLPIKVSDGKFYAERILASIYGSQLYLTAFSSDFKLDNKILDVKNITSELFNGKVVGNINYDMRDEHFKSKISARNVSAEPIFNIISTRKDTISGILNFDSEINGDLLSKQSLLGNIKFIVNNGRMSTLGKLEHLLYAQNVIADNMLRTSLSVVLKAITLKDTGLFKYLQGDIDLENGIAKINILQSQGPLMALFIKGIYNPINDYANLIVLGRLSDEIMTGLGVFGDFSLNKLMIMLTGEEQKNNVLIENFEKIPQLPSKNTKEFRSIINGIIDKPSSVLQFNWISYSEKTYKQKEAPLIKESLPEFINSLPY